MYAVIQAGGRQYKVAEGDTIHLDFIEAPVGSQITFDQVLLAGGQDNTRVGRPFVEGVEVVGEVTAQERGPKLIIFKHRRRHNSQRKNGFRSKLTAVRVTGING